MVSIIETTDLAVAFILVLVIIQGSLTFLHTETSITANMVEKADEQQRLLLCSEALIRSPELLANDTGTIPQLVQNEKITNFYKYPRTCNYTITPLGQKQAHSGFVLRRLVFVGEAKPQNVQLLEVW